MTAKLCRNSASGPHAWAPSRASAKKVVAEGPTAETQTTGSMVDEINYKAWFSEYCEPIRSTQML